jgi:predicted Rossmann-fold nucleotide-binding protein
MEILTLVQTRKGKQIKILLFDSTFWTPLLTWFNTLENNQYIDSTDLDSFELVDSVEEILGILEA